MQSVAPKHSLWSFFKKWLLHWLLFWGGLMLVEVILGFSSRLRRGIDVQGAITDTLHQAWPKLINYSEARAVAILLLGAEFLYHFVFRRRHFRDNQLLVLPVAIVHALLQAAVAGRIALATPLGINILIFSLYTVGYAFVRDIFHRRFHENQLRAEQSETALMALRAQLNPHFFFNTLNTLYGTALEENAQRTAECVEQLAGLMRYTLREAQEKVVTVAQEVRFLEDYLHLQRLRLPVQPNIDVCTAINYDGVPAVIAPLLVLPFLENAFAYGISIEQECFLHFALQIENNQLKLNLENRILVGRDRQSGAGTGLRHVRQRLALLYPYRHELTVHEDEGRFVVKLLISLAKVPLVATY